MRFFALVILFILVQFNFAEASAKPFPFLLKQSEFAKLPQTEQVKYLNAAFQTLAEAELSKKLKSTCVVAGDVFSKTGSACTKKHACSKHEVSCAPYLAEHECVGINSKVAPTIQCLELHPLDNKRARLFASVQSADIFRNIAKGLADYCRASPTPQSCASLEQQTQSHRNVLQPRIPKTSLFNLLRLFFNVAYAAAPCTYDKQTQKFTGQDSQVIEFHFANHSRPDSVVDFYDETADPSANLFKPAQKLITSNSQANEDMRKHTLNMYKKLKNRELTWVGFEGDEELEKSAGGTVAAMSRIAIMEKDLLNSGLSPSDVQLVLINIYNDKYAYYLWFKEQTDPEAASQQVKLIGVDNGRNPRVDQIDDEYKNTHVRDSETFTAIGNIPYASENDQFILKFYDSLKYDDGDINTIERLLKSPESAKITPEMRKAISEYLQVQKERYRLRKERKTAGEQEMKIRDFSMAQDSFSALTKNGHGLTTLGPAHEAGTIAYLIQTCKNYRGNNSGSGSGSGSSSKPKSGSVGTGN